MQTRILDKNGWKTVEMPDIVLSPGFRALQQAAKTGNKAEIDAAIKLLQQQERDKKEKKCK